MVTFKRRRLRDEGEGCPGAAKSSVSGTSATVVTWATRICVGCAFVNFIARAVCRHPSDQRLSDEERDRGVKKFFPFISPFTFRVILAFLESCNQGPAVAGVGREAGGGGKKLSAVTLKDYTSGLSFISVEAALDGRIGVENLVVDYSCRTSPCQATSQPELDKEEKMRADPGTCIVTTMTTEKLKNCTLLQRRNRVSKTSGRLPWPPCRLT